MTPKKHILIKTKSATKKKAKKPTKEVSAPLVSALKTLETVPAPPMVPEVNQDRHCLRRIFQRLIKLSALPAGMDSPLITAEVMYESNLFSIQDYLKHVLEEAANTLGEAEKQELRNRFPMIEWKFN